MTRRVPTLALLAALAFSGLLATATVAETSLPLPLPDTMAAVGDSISQAASTGGTLGADYPENSWSTGTNSTVNSHYLRLLALGAPISGQNHNHAVSGAKAAGLNDQMLTLDALNPDYLTVQIGGNDLCTDTVGEMTSVATFRAQFQAAMDTLIVVSPDTHVYVTSIPDVYQLWSLFKNDWWARFIWSVGGVCQSLLANPTSTLQADVERRASVRQRNIDFNTQLREVCALFSHCRFDNDAVFNTQFTASDVAGDYFHPSVAGQAKLAAGTWAVGFTWAETPPPTLMWIADLESVTAASRNTWTATITMSVAGSGGTNPGSGVVVTGSWSAGSGTTSCTTGTAGTCTVKSSSLSRKNVPSVTFTVIGLSKAGWTYVASNDVESSITVSKP